MSASEDEERRVFVVGSVNEDVRILVDHHARTGETVAGHDGGRELGGKGANQAIAAARAGAAVRFVGAVGADPAGAELRRMLAEDGIDVEALEGKAGLSTGRAIVMVDSQGDNAIVVLAGANAGVTVAQVEQGLDGVRSGDIVLSQLELDAASVREAARVGAERGALVVVNAAPFRADVVEVLRYTDILIVNEPEREDLARLLECPNDSRSVGRVLRERFGTALLCTLGAAGSEFVTDQTIVRVPGEAADVVDTTAAGDTYIGYLVSALAAQLPISAAMRRASVAAGIAVSRPGAARSIPRLSEPAGVVEPGRP